MSLEQTIADLQNELKVIVRNQYLVEEELHLLQKHILEQRIKAKDLQMIIDKGKSSRKLKEIDIKMMTDKFWQEKQHIGLCEK